MTGAASSPQANHLRVVVVGAGQAGLAMSRSLLHAGLRHGEDFAVVDAADPRGAAWRRRWPETTLDIPARKLSLPGIPVPGDPRRRITSAETADYLDGYAAQLGIRPRWDTRIRTLERDPHGHGLLLHTRDGPIRASNVVAATGAHSHTAIPSAAEDARPAGANLHSDDYWYPAQLPSGPVLVVGDGGSGRAIALELSSTHRVTLAQGSRRPPAVRRRGMPAARASDQDLRAAGVALTGRIVSASRTGLGTDDGSVIAAHSIVWATGYRHGFDWLPRPALDGNGDVVHRRGVTAIPGLFIIGVNGDAATAPSRLGRAAARIARHIGRRP